MNEQRIYEPDGEVLTKYLMSTSSLVCVQGPVRSGKSVASIMRIYRGMMEVPYTKGKRRSRWLVTRNTYPDLEESTVKTWLEWFPESVYGRFMWSKPFVHMMRFGDVEADVTFEAFNGDEDIPSLKSREYTGIWANEAQFYSRRFMVALFERTGWFPIPGGPKWLQMDMNAPPHGHWVPMMRGDAPIPEEMDERERRSLIKPPDWEFLVQPAWFTEEIDAQGRVDKYVINPKAENLRIVGERAVVELLDGRTQDEIDADLMNRVTILTTGRPVFPMFRRETHVAKAKLLPADGVPIRVGLDFGRRPAAVLDQQVNGRWLVLDEITAENMGAEEFAPIVKRRLQSHYPGFTFEFWGDPSGSSARGETNDDTAFGIFAKHGMSVRKADNRGLRRIRLETATSIMNRMVSGLPALLISPNCTTIITGLSGGYVFRRKKVTGSPIYEEEPAKNEFSHPIDAMLETFMGGGEGMATLGRERKGIIRTLPKTDAFGRTFRAAGGRR